MVSFQVAEKYRMNNLLQIMELLRAPVSTVRGALVRHDPDRLAAALLHLHNTRSVRLAGGGYRKER